MSSETPPGPPANRPTEPFARGRIVWSRPPKPLFQVGPLPRGSTAPSLTTRPARAPGAGVLSGSMIPRARPVAPEPVAPEPVAPEFVEAVEAEAPVEAVIALPPVEPEPVVAPPEPTPEPVPAAAVAEIVIETDEVERAATVPPPLSTAAEPVVAPRSLPSVVVTPAIYATVGAAIQKVVKKDRWVVVAGIVAVVVIVGFIWLATLPAPQPVVLAPAPVVAGTPVIEDAPLVEEASPAVERPAPVRTAPGPAAAAAAAAPSASAPGAPVTVQPSRAASAASAPVAAPTETAPRPYIQTAPLIVEPPTPAAPASTNPDAPITTRPQPLD